jgi:hypothetical protein
MNAKVLASFLLITTGALSTHASASMVVYTETADITGSLGGVALTDKTLTLTMTGDTSNVVDEGGIFVLIAPLDFTLSGGGSGAFTDEVQAVANQSPRPLAGFGDNTNDEGILFTLNAALATYDLSTSVGPLSGEAIINAGTSFATNAGALVIDSVSGDATFAASVGSAIPEASTWGMLLLGFASLGFLGVRSRKAATIAA